MVLEQLRSASPTGAATRDEEFEIYYNEVQSTKSLTAWLVDPSINPVATAAQVKDNLKLAYTHAAQWVLLAKQTAPCIDRLFGTINVIVTDRAHNDWFTGEILPAQVPAASNFGTSSAIGAASTIGAETRDAVIRGFAVGYFRQTAPGILPAAPAASCTWQQARAQIGTYFDNTRKNLAFTFTVDDLGAIVWAQWVSAGSQANVSTILNLAKEVKCIYPAVDQFNVIIVDAEGVVLLIGSLPKDGIQNLDINKFQILVQKTG